jgi:thiosulfate dehydrogenase [quinone] large subunit
VWYRHDEATPLSKQFHYRKDYIMSTRNLAYALGGIGVVLFALATLDVAGAGGWLTLLSAIVLAIAGILFWRSAPAGIATEAFSDPPIARLLFGDTRSAFFWLFVRLWLGTQWIEAGWHKVNDPKWVSTGVALKGFWVNAVKIPEGGKSPISFDWYRGFIQFMLDNEWYTWFAKIVAFGEVLIGIGLIVGAFVGIAAFFGAFLNWNFIMAGTASTNGLLLVTAVVLILAWKVAGYMGADRYLLARLGVPWRPNLVRTPPIPATT